MKTPNALINKALISNTRLHALVLSVALAGVALTSTHAQAPGDLRVALVIGNAAYAGNAALTNPGNDAKAMSETLRGLGFSVVEVRDGSKAQMTDAIAKVKSTLQGKQAIGMLYYAGHGLQLDWRNYMVPVDAKMNKAADVPEQTVDLSQVIDAFKVAGNRMNIVVLDACRDNPFAGTASGKGLAQLDAPPGTFLAYATAPGNVAEDGDTKSSNGLYTQFLLQELKKPTAKIEDVFKRVRLNVRQQSQGRQIPWESTSLEDDFYFNAGLKPTQKLGESEKDKAFTEEKAAWDKIKDSKSVDDFYTFLQKYPNGNVNALVQAKIEQLQKSKTVVVADQQGLKQSNVFDAYKPGDEYEFVVKDGLTGVDRGRGKIISFARGEDEMEGVSDNPTIIPGARLTRSGFILQDGGGTYDPPYGLYPNGELKVGSRATTRTIQTRNGQKMWLEFDSHVAGRETIDSAFGKISTIRVDVNVLMQNGFRSKRTFWLDPGWGYAVRMTVENRNPRGGAPDVFVRELIARRRTAG
jgi:Caspase domain